MLDVGRSQGSLQAQAGLGCDPRAPHDDDGRDGSCLEEFGAGGTQAVTMAVRKTSGRCPSRLEIEATSMPS